MIKVKDINELRANLVSTKEERRKEMTK